MTAHVNPEREAVNRQRVPRDLRERGIGGLAPGFPPSTHHPQYPGYPPWLKGVTPAYPHHVWGLDVTDIRLAHGGVSRVAILEWPARLVGAWELSETWELPVVLTAAERALTIALPTMWNPDQGSPLIRPHYTAWLLAKEVHISAGVGPCVDGTAVAKCEI